MPIGPMGEPLPYNVPAGPPMGGPMPGAMPVGPPVGNPMGAEMGGGPPEQHEVAQLLALRDQIDQRLIELMGGGVTQSGIGTPAGMPAGPPPNGGMPPAGLLGAGPY
jgi:hypothetical protein|tara:strand:- start:47 stop:367 length:321 start_codon:yes stop_codon:yes gene_type:complete